MFFTIALDVVVAALLLYGQRRIRPVPRALHLRLPVVLGVIGLIQLLDYSDAHHVSSGALWLVIGTTLVGAGVLGVLRALTVRIWESNNWVLRQGTWLTMALWVLSLGVHLTSGIGASHLNAGNFEASSFLLYLALTLGVQAYVVHLRAAPHWNALGPEAGRRVQVLFGSGPGGAGSFFTGFGNPGWGGPGQPYQDPARHDPTIIDVEEVDDSEPPELR